MPCRLQMLSIQNVLSCALYLVALTIQRVSLTLLSTIFFFEILQQTKQKEPIMIVAQYELVFLLKIKWPLMRFGSSYAILAIRLALPLQPVFVSKKLGQDLKPKEIKPSIVNKHCVVYHFSCDLCDADYVGYTVRHLHQRIAEHKNSAIGRHFLEAHGNNNLFERKPIHSFKEVPGQTWLFSIWNAVH